MGLYSSYYAYGLPTFFAIVVALYLLFTGESASMQPNLASTTHIVGLNRFWGGVQRWPVPRGDEPVCLGIDGDRIVYRAERVGGRVVRVYCIARAMTSLPHVPS